ncbi:hypothetical protein [Methylomonas fluvii]|uniref:Uncharacterized protein n=1 Tax=Methylomonas fluvii TaxID=1854564 RepID=A0ABR9DJL0_9GAMM|nr:hypothetical protein [Methylomonas fluvii]MBD9363051.1 hypothetical protein [Methylomonas fluvii]CAD6876273.1 hypothetical protein [Methylomonas fluvii]
MKHIITATILVLALTCYLAGYSGVGNIGFAVGASLETWFWIRILIKRPSAKSDSSSMIS